MPYTANFGTIPKTDEPIEAPGAETPFRIAVLADFSGRQNRGITRPSKDIAALRMVRVSRDTLDEVMAKLGVALKLPVGGDTVKLSFASLDDFHPDQIHDRVDQIADLYEAEEKSESMNSVLHHPDFQGLESAWRGLDWLLSRAMKGSKVEVHLLDISFAELAADLKTFNNLAAVGLHQVLIDKGIRGPQGNPWPMLVGNYTFDLTGQHAELLGRLAKIAAQANAPFLTTVHPKALDASFKLSADAAPAWQALRQLPEAALLGIALPRFLLRLPFGENTQSIDKFSYEEASRPPDRSQYLSGNPALACAALLAQTFHQQGWGCKPGTVLDLENLPIHVFTVDDDEETTLAEAWLARQQIEQLVKLGIMTLLCVRGKGAMKLFRFMSLAQPTKDQPVRDLQGHWTGSTIAPTPQVAAPPSPKVGMVAAVPERHRRAPPPEPAPAEPSVSTPAARAVPAPPPVSMPDEETPPAPEAAEPAAEEEMDPDLAALLKELE